MLIYVYIHIFYIKLFVLILFGGLKDIEPRIFGNSVSFNLHTVSAASSMLFLLQSLAAHLFFLF